MGSISDHPGYLGFTSAGVIAIHADWPVYPIEHGWPTALFNLCCYPAKTKFRAVDDIDQCVLFQAEYPMRMPGQRRLEMHAALWHEDLKELADQLLITGPRFGTQREWEEARREKLRDEMRATMPDLPDDADPLDYLAFKKSDGTTQRVVLPPLDDYYDDEDEDFPSDGTWFLPGSKRVDVTEAGLKRFEQLAQSLESALPEALAHRVSYLLDGGLLDTAVREVAVAVEVAMRTKIRSDSYGNVLIREFFDQLQAAGGFIPSAMKTHRAEITAAFKFVRNEFAHNAVELTLPQARALVFRLARCLAIVSSLTE